MLGLFRRPVKKKEEVKKPCVVESAEPHYGYSFSDHMSRYIGQTVTIFVTAGGPAGMGFTGILISVNRDYVRLTTRIGPAPACSLGSACAFPTYRYYAFNLYTNNYYNWLSSGIVNALGSVACIPIGRIASFVHTDSAN